MRNVIRQSESTYTGMCTGIRHWLALMKFERLEKKTPNKERVARKNTRYPISDFQKKSIYEIEMCPFCGVFDFNPDEK